MDTGWTEQEWMEIREAATSTFVQVTRVTALLPAGPEAPDPYRVSVPQIDRKQAKKEPYLELNTETSALPVHIGCKFKVAAPQLRDLNGIKQLARAAAQNLGIAESLLVYAGNTRSEVEVAVNELLTKLKVEVAGEFDGLLTYSDCDVVSTEDSDDALVDVFIKGVDELLERGHNGPYALILPSLMWRKFQNLALRASDRQAVRSMLGEDLVSMRAPIDVGPLLDESDDMSRGLLMSMGNHPVDIIRIEPVDVGVVCYEDGGLLMRVEERVVIRLNDPFSRIDVSLKKKRQPPRREKAGKS